MNAKRLIAFWLVLTAIAPASEAREVKFRKKVMPGLLQGELKEAGFQVQHITCVDDACVMSLPDSEKKDPAPIISRHVYRDLAAVWAERRARLKSMLKRLREKTITAEERDSLLETLTEAVVGE